MIKIQRFIDKYIGGILCLALSLSSRRVIREPQRIAVVKLWAVGESVLTLPMIASLKKRFPHASLSVFCRLRNKQVYAGLPFIDEIIVCEPESLRTIWSLRSAFDIVIDCEPYLNISALLTSWIGGNRIGFSHGMRSLLYDTKIEYDDGQHVVLTYMDLVEHLSIHSVPTSLVQLSTSKSDVLVVKSWLKNQFFSRGKIFGICASAAESGLSRLWPLQNYGELINVLVETHHASIILVGTKKDQGTMDQLRFMSKYPERVGNAAGATTLGQLFALVKKCNVFISNDTGPMHVAAAQGVPTVGLFDPNTPVRFAPYGRKNGFVYKPTRPFPCINVHKGVIDCKHSNHMSKITVEDVLKEITTILQ